MATSARHTIRDFSLACPAIRADGKKACAISPPTSSGRSRCQSHLSENGKSKRVSTQEALILRLREKALKGDARALETLLSLARTHNEDFVGQSQDRSLAVEDQTILDAYIEDELARRLQSHGVVRTTDADDHKGGEEGR